MYSIPFTPYDSEIEYALRVARKSEAEIEQAMRTVFTANDRVDGIMRRQVATREGGKSRELCRAPGSTVRIAAAKCFWREGNQLSHHMQRPHYVEDSLRLHRAVYTSMRDQMPKWKVKLNHALRSHLGSRAQSSRRLVIFVIGLDASCFPQPPMGNLADPSRPNRLGRLDESRLTLKVLRNAPVQAFGCVFLLVLGDEGVPRGHIGRDGLFAEDVLARPQGGENNLWLDGDR
jgi:hypothetical protein